MKILNHLKKFSKYIAYISMALIFVMMLFMSTDVALQMSTGVGILGNYEIVEIMMVCLVYFAFGYTQTSGRHVAVDLLKDHMPKFAQKIINLFLNLISALAGAIMTTVSYVNIIEVMRDRLETATLGIKLFPFYGVVCFGSAVLTLTFFISVIESVINLLERDGEKVATEH